jgi:tRNA pseudouridine65 synthase
VKVAPLRVLHRDADLIVVDKPAGLLTHRSELAPDRDVAMTRVRDAIGARVWPLHRLDRGTSGVLAFALSEAAARALRAAFEQGSVEKVYVAIARGEAPEHVVVDHPVPRAEGAERVPAVTELRRLFAGSYFSIVEARPKTGRFHQIRRHLSHLRHPIAGDSNYGTGWFNRKIRAETGLSRLALHALSIRLPTVTVVAPLARDFEQALDKLGVPRAVHSSDLAARIL